MKEQPYVKDGRLYLPWLWLRNEGLLAWRDAYGANEIVHMLLDNPHRCPAIEKFAHLHSQDIIVEPWVGPKGGLKGYVISARHELGDHEAHGPPPLQGEGSVPGGGRG